MSPRVEGQGAVPVPGGGRPDDGHWLESLEALAASPVPNGEHPTGAWRDRLRISTGADLAATDPGPVQTLPLLGQDGYVPVGFTTALAAYPKVGKTTLLAAAVREWLAMGRRVLWLSEESVALWQYRLSGSGWDGLDVVHAAGADLADLRAAVAEATYDVLVVDTVRSVLQLEDETDNSKIRAAVEPWVLTVRERRKTGVLSTHETKAGGAHGRGMAGGHALLGVVDGLLTLRRDSKPTHRVVEPLHRLPAQHVEARELVYTMEPSGRLWCVTKLQQDPQRDARDRLVEYVADNPGCAHVQAREAIGGKVKVAEQVIADSIARGLLEDRGPGGQGKRREYHIVEGRS